MSEHLNNFYAALACWVKKAKTNETSKVFLERYFDIYLRNYIKFSIINKYHKQITRMKWLEVKSIQFLYLSRRSLYLAKCSKLYFFSTKKFPSSSSYPITFKSSTPPKAWTILFWKALFSLLIFLYRSSPLLSIMLVT